MSSAHGRRSLSDLWRGDNGGLFGLCLLFVVLFVLFSAIAPDTFAQAGTVQSMMFQVPELGLLSLAMVLPLISGGLNLSIIATANQAALLMGWILTTRIPPGADAGTVTLWIAIALVAGFVLCAMIGAVTGWLIAVLGVHPILVTLGTMTLLSGISIFTTRGTTLSRFPEQWLWIANRTVFGIPVSFLLFALLAFGVHLLLTRRPLGLKIHMVGSNLDATRYSGVDTRRVLISVYTLSSLLCWVAAIVMMARFNSASAAYAQSYLLVTILAAILGGIDPYGGFGRVSGLFVALLILQTISSGFNLLGVSSELTLALWGLTLIAVMAVKRGLVLWRVHALTRRRPPLREKAATAAEPVKIP